MDKLSVRERGDMPTSMSYRRRRNPTTGTTLLHQQHPYNNNNNNNNINHSSGDNHDDVEIISQDLQQQHHHYSPTSLLSSSSSSSSISNVTSSSVSFGISRPTTKIPTPHVSPTGHASSSSMYILNRSPYQKHQQASHFTYDNTRSNWNTTRRSNKKDQNNNNTKIMPLYIFIMGAITMIVVFCWNVTTILVVYLYKGSANDTPFWTSILSHDDNHRSLSGINTRTSNRIIQSPSSIVLMRSSITTTTSVSSYTIRRQQGIQQQQHLFPVMVQLVDDVPTSQRPLFQTYYVRPPKQMNHVSIRPDYGKLTIKTSDTINKVVMNPIDSHHYELYRHHILETMDEPHLLHYYIHYDDLDFSDLNPNPLHDTNIPDNDEANPASCERPKWGYNSYPNCNTIHEVPTLDTGMKQQIIRPLGSGYFRDTFSISSENHHVAAVGTIPESETYVMKRLRFMHEHNGRFQYEMNMEARIMEITTASNVISNIYGYCSTTILLESLLDATHSIVPFKKKYQQNRGRISNNLMHQFEKQQAIKNWKLYNNTYPNGAGSKSLELSDPYSFNQLTMYDKLQYATQMVQSVVELHGYIGGVIVHDDLHPDQFLFSLDKQRIVLNDINNAVILQWSRQNHQYCTYWDQYGGDYRAPEVYVDGGTETTNEKVDIYPIGYLIYSLITGLYPYHNITDANEGTIQQLAINNVPLYIHPKLRNFNISAAIKQLSSRSKPTTDQSSSLSMSLYHPDQIIEMFICNRLIYIMDQCLQYDPKHRPSIFTVYNNLLQVHDMVRTLEMNIQRYNNHNNKQPTQI